MNASMLLGTLRLLCAIGGLIALAAGVVSPARAGGPLDLVNHQPVIYANGGASLRLNVDQGPFGTRSNAQALALVQTAIGLWNGVGTSTMRLSIGPSLSTDYNTSNYAGIFNNFSDGFNPVIFDSDGSITNAIFGAGAKSSILGFAGSAYFTSGPSAGKYAEGRAVLNGSLNISDGLWTVVLALHAAVPLVASGTAAQPAIVVPESLKLTVPVGATPAIVAVNVTVAPTVAGFAELARAVDVGAGAVADDPQLPLTLPVPFRRNVAVARQPGVIAICCGDAPPSATGAIGCGDWNERSCDEFE